MNGSIFSLLLSASLAAAANVADLPTVSPALASPPKTDWLVTPPAAKAGVYRGASTNELVLDNGLIRRTFRLTPNAACVGFDGLITGTALLRSVRPEAELEINGQRLAVGGLSGQPIHNYLKAGWLDRLKADPRALRFTNFEVGQTAPRFPWKQMPTRRSEGRPWPPPGVLLTLAFAAPPELAATNAALEKLTVRVHYELYDGLPLLCKWLTIGNGSHHTVRLNSFASEVLAFAESDSQVEAAPKLTPPLHVETDYAFAAGNSADAQAAVAWETDPTYTTQVSYHLRTACLLKCRPPLGPDVDIKPGETFEGFRTWELVFDSTDRERRGLAQRRMYRAIAPWVTENPLIFHTRSASPASVRTAIDQAAEVGFELVLMTFGSGFNFESTDPAYHAKYKDLADYARSKGLDFGSYSLLASRGAARAEDNCVGQSMFGVMPCLGANWGRDYLGRLRSFITNANLTVLEHDGSYPGDKCASTDHPFHRGLADSQWVQWRAITGFYRWCRANGVYLNIPDWYYLNGGSKCAMGYRETNWSLPRDEQEIIERQNIFDGTWEKTPSMGWMFVPLTEYHGGGAAATIEPLKDHLPHYEARLVNLLGSGVQACWRGPRLFDTDETKAVVKKWVTWFKQHRAILESDLIHVRRADGRDFDCVLHVNPQLREKALAMIWNPLPQPIERHVELPLYYAGLTDRAQVRERDGEAKPYRLSRDYKIAVPVSVPAKSFTWLVIE